MVQTLKMILTLLMFTSFFLNISHAEKMIKKCCGEGELLNPKTKKCFPKPNVENGLTFFPTVLFDLHVKPGATQLVKNVIFNDSMIPIEPEFPSCTNNNNDNNNGNNNGLQILQLDDGKEDYFLTTDGTLASLHGKYELSRDLVSISPTFYEFIFLYESEFL